MPINPKQGAIIGALTAEWEGPTEGHSVYPCVGCERDIIISPGGDKFREQQDLQPMCGPCAARMSKWAKVDAIKALPGSEDIVRDLLGCLELTDAEANAIGERLYEALMKSTLLERMDDAREEEEQRRREGHDGVGPAPLRHADGAGDAPRSRLPRDDD